MAIQLNVAASLDQLSKAIITDLSDERPGVFDKQWVITQTEGINTWLKYQLAESAGIAANLECAKVNDIFQQLYIRLCPGAPALLDKDRMTWTIFSVLTETDFKNQFPEITRYYEDNDSRRIALAAEMADLFDQYQIYRLEKIKKWNEAVEDAKEDHPWQSFLWKRMKTLLQGKHADRLEISNRLLQSLRNPDHHEDIRLFIPCLRFFGVAIVTPYFLELFRELSTIIEVKFYLLNPCPDQLWMDDLSDQKIAKWRKKPELQELRSVGNELLINWGSVLRESYQLLLEKDEYVNQYEVIDSGFDDTVPQTLLQWIQAEIRQNVSNQERKEIPGELLKDDSFAINGCYTPVREVEVFYNHLLEAFAKDPSLGAREVVVMVTDIDTYGPFIRAVFDNAPVAIPYSIADESVSKGNGLFTGIREILSINADTFKAEEVLSLLDSPYIVRRFGFSDVAAVRQAVREAGISFGIGSKETSDSLYEQTEAWMVSWEYGLQKIMYGLCMSGEAPFDGGTRSLYPLDTAEGAAMQDRIRLYQFIQVLTDIVKERSAQKTLTEWSDYLGKIMTDMILEEEEEDEDLPRFASLKEKISALDELSGGIKLSYATFQQVFFSRLEEERRTGRYGGKGVTFCSMLPMRSIPYKIVAMLGMDFDQFPRQDSALSFSLIGKEKRPGDRSVRENDKHLFLESILAANQQLYISYIARDVQKGTAVPPSTIVDELLDYVALNTADPNDFKKSKVRIHPLHLFSNRYREKESGWSPNYLGNTLMEGSAFAKAPSKEKEESKISSVSLNDFAAFFKHPVKQYFNKVLGVYYYNEGEQIAETEIFELDPLQKWGLKDDLLHRVTDKTIYKDRSKKSGRLPLANMGDLEYESLLQEIAPFEEVYQQLKNNESLRHCEVEYLAGDLLIKGGLAVYGNRFIICTTSSKALHHAMEAWIKYLVAVASETIPNLSFDFVFKKKEAPFLFSVAPGTISPAEARKWIETYRDYFISGQHQVFSFHPQLGYWYYKLSKNKQPVRSLNSKTLRDQYESEKSNNKGDFSGDEYLRKVIETAATEESFFSPDNVAHMNQIVPSLMERMYELCSDLF
ncbi:MAG: exodeoxyribonuclease V subunit gamma [Bacteroidetes bacterium]|nr:exodeoxyribonuclease V subunit gamma [Bacteroidota bacterium]